MYPCTDPTAPRSMSADERLEEIARILQSAFLDTSVGFGDTTASAKCDRGPAQPTS